MNHFRELPRKFDSLQLLFSEGIISYERVDGCIVKNVGEFTYAIKNKSDAFKVLALIVNERFDMLTGLTLTIRQRREGGEDK